MSTSKIPIKKSINDITSTVICFSRNWGLVSWQTGFLADQIFSITRERMAFSRLDRHVSSERNYVNYLTGFNQKSKCLSE